MRELISRERLRRVPSGPGVYLLTGRDPRTAETRVLYVGKSVNLRRRLASYRGIGSDRAPRRLVRLAFTADEVIWEACADDHEARLRENFLLRLHRPKFNSANTHPESHWYAVLKAGEGFVELARRPEPPGEGQCFGAFKHLDAFAALLRTLWVALNASGDLSKAPANLFGAKARASLRLKWDTTDGNGAEFQTLHRRLSDYFSGVSDALLVWFRERLGPTMAQAGFAHTWLTTDLESLERFYAGATRRNAELRRRFGVAGTLLRKAELDDLLALADATRAARNAAPARAPERGVKPN